MNRVEVKLDYFGCSEVFDQDLAGNLLEGSKAKRAIVIIPLRFKTASFSVDALLLSRFPKDLLPIDVDVRAALFFYTHLVLKTTLTCRRSWNIFRTEEIDLKAHLPQPIPRLPVQIETSDVELSCKVQSQMIEGLKVQAVEDKKMREVFMRAVDQLKEFAYELTAIDFECRASEIYSLLRLIRTYVECSSERFMYSWYREKIRGLDRAFQELIRRKRESHRMYRYYRDYAQRTLFGFDAPRTWAKKPPSSRLACHI